MFRVGLTRDFLTPEGELVYKSIGLDMLDAAENIEYEFLKEHISPITPDMIQGFDAIISLSPAYNSKSFEGLTGLKAICRFGVGYDMVDVDACNEANVILTITKGAVNHSVAEAIITWMLSLSHRVFEKDKLVRKGLWNERSKYMGKELRGKTLGIIGIGGIGTKLVEMLKPFYLGAVIAYDPFADKLKMKNIGVELVGLDVLMSESDFVSVNCPLNKGTRNLVGKNEIQLMKKEAYIINTARGGIINEQALINALKNSHIAGYATDVFEEEPPLPNNKLFELNNVIVAPHCIAWTDELFEEIGRTVCMQIIQLSNGETPSNVVNNTATKA